MEVEINLVFATNRAKRESEVLLVDIARKWDPATRSLRLTSMD